MTAGAMRVAPGGGRAIRRGAVALAVLLLVGTAVAAPIRAAEPAAGAIFQRLDENADGIIDPGEFSRRKMQVFYHNDADGDGYLAREETVVSAAVFDAADRDGDGRISGFEFVEAGYTDFERVDANADGVITREEFDAFVAQVVGPRGG